MPSNYIFVGDSSSVTYIAWGGSCGTKSGCRGVQPDLISWWCRCRCRWQWQWEICRGARMLKVLLAEC